MCECTYCSRSAITLSLMCRWRWRSSSSSLRIRRSSLIRAPLMSLSWANFVLSSNTFFLIMFTSLRREPGKSRPDSSRICTCGCGCECGCVHEDKQRWFYRYTGARSLLFRVSNALTRKIATWQSHISLVYVRAIFYMRGWRGSDLQLTFICFFSMLISFWNCRLCPLSFLFWMRRFSISSWFVILSSLSSFARSYRGRSTPILIRPWMMGGRKMHIADSNLCMHN